MAMLGKRSGRFGPDPLSWRVWGAQRGVLRFELLQLAKQPVVLGVREFGLVEDVILVIRPV